MMSALHATVVMEGRKVLQNLDYTVQSGRGILPVLSDGQDVVMMRKEGVRQEILQKIAEFLGEST
ncbi:MAG: hypothetical protein AAB737_01055 [Patescibacteria group bacterium]